MLAGLYVYYWQKQTIRFNKGLTSNTLALITQCRYNHSFKVENCEILSIHRPKWDMVAPHLELILTNLRGLSQRLRLVVCICKTNIISLNQTTSTLMWSVLVLCVADQIVPDGMSPTSSRQPSDFEGKSPFRTHPEEPQKIINCECAQTNATNDGHRSKQVATDAVKSLKNNTLQYRTVGDFYLDRRSLLAQLCLFSTTAMNAMFLTLQIDAIIVFKALAIQFTYSTVPIDQTIYIELTYG